MARTFVAAKRRGRKPTGKGTLIGVRLQPLLLAALDKFISEEKGEQSSRPQAVRLILDDWLKARSYLRITVEDRKRK